MRIRIFLVCLGSLIILAACSNEYAPVQPADLATQPQAAVASAPVNPGVIPPGATPHGKTYAEWSAIWWQWMFSAPVGQNPGLDETGANIGWSQSGPVWFLAPNFGGTSVRSGVIPAGKSIFLDVLAWESSALEGLGTTLEELQAYSHLVADDMRNITFEIDGVPVTGLDAYRFQSPGLFGLTLPDNNVFQLMGYDAPAGYYYPAASEGYYLMLAPLSVGEHTLHWTGDIPMIGHSQDITFHLTVIGGRQGRTAEAR